MLFITRGMTSPTAAVTAGVTGPAVDLVTCEDRCFAIQVLGTIQGVGVTVAGKLQEATTATGTYSDISGATFTTISTTGGGGNIQVIGFTRSLEYVRYVAAVAGGTLITGTTTTVLAIALDVVIGGQRNQV